MILRSLFTLVLIAALPALAQNGLKDIPDTKIEAELQTFKTIDGAKVQLFASEPAIVNPTQMNWDAQGRLWVVCSGMYPHIVPGAKEEDKVVILEDTDGDGVADRHTDFAKDLYIPTSVAPGDGGAYIANSTEVLFLRDTDGDGVADERRIALSGFGTEDTHHLVHTFRWGPEGMLWMNQSIYIHTHLDTPYGIRRLLGGGMWHYRPETRRAEVFMKGLINPWGHAFDQWGQSFMTDGAGGEGINFVFPRSVFATSPGASRILHGLNPGQPKHCGLEFLTGQHVSPALRGMLAACDFRGNRVNLFQLADRGSSYTSTQQPDLVSSTHGAFRPIDVKMGPDGAIYIADWYNPIIQHGEVDFRDPRRDHTHGRIWRITFEGRALDKKPEIAKATESELAHLLHSDSGWVRNAATVELRSRPAEAVIAALTKSSPEAGEDSDLFTLRKVWAGQAINHFDSDASAKLCQSQNPKIRAAALRALYYDAADLPVAFECASRAVNDPNLQVRLWAVSVLAQCASPDTVKIALKALDGIEVDEELDFAIWSICREHAARWRDVASNGNPFATPQQLLYAVRALNEPLAIPQILNAMESGKLSTDADIASIAEWIAKVGSPDDLGHLLNYALNDGTTQAQQASLLKALDDAVRLRKLQPSGDLARVVPLLRSSDPVLFSSSAFLAGHWKLEAAREELVQAFRDAPKDEGRARAALDGLIALGGPDSIQLFGTIGTNQKAPWLVRSLAVIGMTRLAMNRGAKLAVTVLADSPDGHDPFGIYDLILSSKNGPPALTAALDGATLPEAIALTGVNKAKASPSQPTELIAALEKAGSLQQMKAALTPEEMEAMMKQVAQEGDPQQGESIYRRPALQCTVCHAIGGIGGHIGPDLVSIGASAPVDYLIDSLLEPSKKIKEGYHTVFVTLKNGTSVAGAIAREDASEIVIRDAAGKENRILKSDVAKQEISPVSMMPPGLTASLRQDEFVHLIRFLSELGKDGPYKMSSRRFVRQWQALHPHPSTRDRIGHYGTLIFAQSISDYLWTPFYATVAGTLPFPELPDMAGRGRGPESAYGVLRTFLNAQSPGTFQVQIKGDLAALNLFLNEDQIDLPKDGEEAIITLSRKEAGRFKLTLVGQKVSALSHVSIELLEDASKLEPVSESDFK